MISNQGFRYKLFLEGILTPFVSANVSYQGYVPTASISMFPSKAFKHLKAGTLVHLFFKSLGTDEEYKLLFSGYLSGKSFAIRGDSREYSIQAFGRLGMLHSITLGSVLNYTAAAANIRSLRYGKELSQTEMQSAMGTGLLKAHASTQTDIVDEASQTSLYLDLPKLAAYQSAPSTATSQESITQEKNDSARPAQQYAAKLSLAKPNALSKLLTDLISDACNSSHDYYSIAYYHRFFIESFISQMPPTWENYIAQLGDGNSVSQQRFTQAIDNAIAASLGGMSSLAGLIDMTLQFYFSEMREVPGLNIGGAVIMPTLLQSDIPACNIILPSERIAINIADQDANRITRVITHAHPSMLGEDFANNYGGELSMSGVAGASNKYANLMAAAMFPDVFAIAKDQIEAKGEIKALKSYMLKNEEYTGSRIKTFPYPADYLHTHIDGNVHQDVTEHMFFLAKNAHMNLSITLPFSPNLIPGMRAILFDKHTPMIFKIEALSHIISNDGSNQTSINASQVEYLDGNDATFRHPTWYDGAYELSQIHSLYQSHFGCTSMTDSAKTPGDVTAAYKYIYEKYEASETKSYMAEILTKRKFDTEAEVFAQFAGSNAAQTHDTATDGSGVLIYRSEAFDNYAFDGYDYGMNNIKLINDRQTPVIEYIKTIYGIIGDSYD